MSRILVLVLLLLPPMANAAGDLCNGIVPATAVKAVSKTFPAYRMPKSSDNLADDVRYNLSQNGTGCLGIARGDFDSDGNQDYLIGLSSTKGNDVAIVVALSRKTGWSVEHLASWLQGRTRLFVEIGAPGTYKRTEALEGPLSEAGEVLTLTCKHQVAIFGAIESSGVAYCRQRSKWSHVWISD